jgi:hypothetical protein
MLLRSGCWRSRPPSSGAAAAKGPEPAPLCVPKTLSALMG